MATLDASGTPRDQLSPGSRGGLRNIDRITRAALRARPDVLAAFGDNVERRGLGGQARECRGEPNAVGIPTKHAPSRSVAAYFDDTDAPSVVPLIDVAFDRLEAHLRAGGEVWWPSAGVGTGLSELDQRAPRIAAHVGARLSRLREIAGIG